VLRDHRRALIYSAMLLAVTASLFIVVGANPVHPAVQPIDAWWERMIDGLRSPIATAIAKALDLLGGAFVTLPIRILVALWLLFRRRWRAFATWMLTWALSEITVTLVKTSFDRPRPLGALVPTTGASFPSGHATAVAATAVALVLVLLPEGPTRRKWEVTALVVTTFMSLSRTYLNAHWLSDVLAGSLLGAGIAILSAGITTEVRDIVMRRRARRAAPADDGSEASTGVTPTGPG
jgi:membrane-associated phospholipid phosphatase